MSLSTWTEISRLLDQKRFSLALRESFKLSASYSSIPDYLDEEAYQTLERVSKLQKYVDAYQEGSK